MLIHACVCVLSLKNWTDVIAGGTRRMPSAPFIARTEVYQAGTSARRKRRHG